MAVISGYEAHLKLNEISEDIKTLSALIVQEDKELVDLKKKEVTDETKKEIERRESEIPLLLKTLSNLEDEQLKIGEELKKIKIYY